MQKIIFLRLAVILVITIAMSPALFSQGFVIEPNSIDFGRVPIGLAGLPGAYREVTITNQTGYDATLQMNTINLTNPESFELFSPETAAIHPILRQIYDAAGCYRQDYGEDPNRAYDLVELGYLHIDEEILWNWRFSLIGQDPLTQIEAEGPLVVYFDVQTGRFSTYDPRIGEIEPFQQVELSSGQSKTLVVSYAPELEEEIAGSISFTADAEQVRLGISGIAYAKTALSLSTEEIEFGEVYEGRRRSMPFTITNTAGIVSWIELEYSAPLQFYTYLPDLLPIHDYMLVVYDACLRYQVAQGSFPRRIEQLIEGGFLNGDDAILNEWQIRMRGAPIFESLEASSTELFSRGRGFEIRFNVQDEVFSGDGFNFSQAYRTTIAKDGSLNLMMGFVSSIQGDIDEIATIKTYVNGGNQFQEFEIALHGTGLSVSGQEQKALPESITLSPPFPSPFNSTTIVSFQTPYTGEAALSLVDMNGRTMRSWIPAFTGMENGKTAEFKFAINADGLAAGTYWVRVDQAGHSAQQRVVLVR